VGFPIYHPVQVGRVKDYYVGDEVISKRGILRQEIPVRILLRPLPRPLPQSTQPIGPGYVVQMRNRTILNFDSMERIWYLRALAFNTRLLLLLLLIVNVTLTGTIRSTTNCGRHQRSIRWW
jgi:hypothetical protein